MKVVGFNATFAAVEIIIGVHPGVIRGIGQAIFRCDKNARRSRLARRVAHRNGKMGGRPEIVADFGDQLPLSAAGNVFYPERDVAAAVGDESNVLAIG